MYLGCSGPMAVAPGSCLGFRTLGRRGLGFRVVSFRKTENSPNHEQQSLNGAIRESYHES